MPDCQYTRSFARQPLVKPCTADSWEVHSSAKTGGSGVGGKAAPWDKALALARSSANLLYSSAAAELKYMTIRPLPHAMRKDGEGVTWSLRLPSSGRP